MRFEKNLRSALYAVIGLLSACAPNAQEKIDVAQYWQKYEVTNGEELNGVDLNGVTANGLTLNGLTLNGLTLNGLTLNGTNITGTPDGSSVAVSGTELVGANMVGQLSDSSTINLRITAIDNTSSSGLYLYNVAIVQNSNNTEVLSPLCGTSPISGLPIPAVPLSGTWSFSNGSYSSSSTLFTMACVHTAIGKCVLWGYHPWDSKTECQDESTCKSQSLANWHQACTRMVRADYCGNGSPHTVNGTAINVWDAFSPAIQAHETVSGFTREAEWTQSGARCIERTRWSAVGPTHNSMTDYDYVQLVCPERLTYSGSSCSTTEDCETGFECASGVCRNSDCLSDSGSDFFTSVGYDSPLSSRRVLRNEAEANDYY